MYQHLAVLSLTSLLTASQVMSQAPSLSTLQQRCSNQYDVCVSVTCETFQQNSLYVACTQRCLGVYKQCTEEALTLEREL